MPSYWSALLVTLLVAVAFAAPTTHQRKARSFKVNRVRNVNFSGYDGTAELLKALGKYGMSLPEGFTPVSDALPLFNELGQDATSNGGELTDTTPDSVSTATTTSSGEVGDVTNTPTPEDVEFLSPVTIGGQTLNMDFDTGSSDFWVFNTQLDANVQANRNVYDPAKSSTFRFLEGASFNISYGDGSAVAGNVGTDTVNIGGAIVQNQAVELATSLSGSFLKDTRNDGLVGLAFSKLNTVQPAQQQTFFDRILPDLAEPVFTANLRASASGDYEFGKIDSSKFSGSLSWAPINAAHGFWQFSSEQFSVSGGQTVKTPGAQAIADTGTTLMLVNPEMVNAYYSQVEGATNNKRLGGITFPCSSTLPDLQVDIGGNYMANIPGHLINFASSDGTTCYGALQSTTSNLQIYGDILFKAQFVAFNGQNNSIGMAPHQT